MALAGKGRMLEPYTLTPLSVGSSRIRLLDIFDASDSDQQGELIRGNLRTVDLEQNPTFYALSYVWGSSSLPPRTVICGTTSLPVTDNCHAALRNLRQTLGAFTIWIDAICINQEDEKEKAHQITLMSSIYSGAANVFVWLGEGNPTTERVMTYLGRAGLVEYFMEDADADGLELRQPNSWRAFWSLYRARWTKDRRPLPFRMHTRSSWWLKPIWKGTLTPRGAAWVTYDDLYEFLDTNWVRRIWTYQELMCARNITLVSGTSYLKWSNFAFSIVFLDYIGRRTHAAGIIATWRKLALSKARFDVLRLDENLEEMLSFMGTRLQRYQYFVHRVAMHFAAMRQVLWIGRTLAFIGIITLLSFMAFGGSSEPIDYRFPITMLVICVLVVLATAQSSRLSWVAYFPDYPATPDSDQRLHDSTEDLLDAICTRQATNLKDLAFGTHSIIEQMIHRDLATPDYTKSQEQIYEELAVTMLEVTGSLQLLPLAALYHIPDKASWVPDWSSNFSLRWTRPEMFMPNNTFLPSTSTPGSEPSRLYHVDQDSLFVRGYKLAVLSKCTTLIPTEDTYNPSEDGSHLANLRIMMAVMVSSFHQSIEGLIEWLLDSKEGVEHRPSTSGTLTLAQLLNYETVLRRHRDDELDELFRLLRSHGIARKPFSERIDALAEFDWQWEPKVYYREILRMHILICNHISKAKLRVFQANDPTSTDLVQSEGSDEHVGPRQRSLSDVERLPLRAYSAREGKREIVGFAHENATAGDTIMFVPGSSLPLIVRPKDSALELVSPAMMPLRWSNGMWYEYVPLLEDDNNLERLEIV